MMKRFISMLAVLVLALGVMSGCAKNDSSKSDLEYVQNKKELVVGITDFAPMDYTDENNEWIGFDADMAKAFAKSLGVSVKFKVIEWDFKIKELEDKGIDCVWNGMTIGDEVLAGMEVSNPYCKNAQVVVLKADNAENYKTLDSVKELSFVVEAGSAGKKTAEANGFKYKEAGTQADTLLEVSSGTSQASIIDLLMAGAMIGEGTDYADLTYTVPLTEEEYGVGFRKGSDLAAKLNDFFKTSYADGSMMELANKYGVQESVIAQ